MSPHARWTNRDDEAVTHLVATVSSSTFGQVSPSAYETARLIDLAPWLGGHVHRVQFLLSTQNADGSWGMPDGYAVVPTLSATEALLSALRTPESIGDVSYGKVLHAATSGLRTLFGWLGSDERNPVPDTIAVELLVPWLVARLNEQLDWLQHEPLVGLDAWCGPARLNLPAGVDDLVLTRLRQTVRSGHSLPAKVWHSLEAFDSDGRHAPFVQPVNGAVCGSPAATAAWLGQRAHHHHASVRYLNLLQTSNGGPVPGVAPIDVFEPAWVAATLVDAGVRTVIPRKLVARMRDAVTKAGAPAGTGLPADSDDTAAVLYALARLGQPISPQSLWGYQAASYFRCFPGELTPSTSTNAHIIDALGVHAHLDQGTVSRCRQAINTVTAWLLDRQQADGSWWDKWHASPYYATACCANSLTRFGGELAATAVAGAVRWVLDTQRADGSWGRWAGTVEETAYAVQVLLHSDATADGQVASAALRGAGFLRVAGDAGPHPPLWHDKDLYAPVAVIRAARLAALRLASTSLGTTGTDHAVAPDVLPAR